MLALIDRVLMLTAALEVSVNTLGALQTELHILSESSTAELTHLEAMTTHGMRNVAAILRKHKEKSAAK